MDFWSTVWAIVVGLVIFFAILFLIGWLVGKSYADKMRDFVYTNLPPGGGNVPPTRYTT